jgi:hypothetical protein
MKWITLTGKHGAPIRVNMEQAQTYHPFIDDDANTRITLGNYAETSVRETCEQIDVLLGDAAPSNLCGWFRPGSHSACELGEGHAGAHEFAIGLDPNQHRMDLR